eukprot:TRINITY_DN8334_c0_g1_i1.p1 TRINITY_DN8334_c0_g1~~TRINITY_DN8334_c0_g1_i1.p1  ORF type:complete len:200 (-),score=66.63 TRINITY_DN8334_c0_g1_i1:29-628(-)
MASQMILLASCLMGAVLPARGDSLYFYRVGKEIRKENQLDGVTAFEWCAWVKTQGVVPGTSSSTLTTEQIDKWGRAGCEELLAAPPSMADVETCKGFAQDFETIPGVSWGRLPGAKQAEWHKLKCDKIVGNGNKLKAPKKAKAAETAAAPDQSSTLAPAVAPVAKEASAAPVPDPLEAGSTTQPLEDAAAPQTTPVPEL